MMDEFHLLEYGRLPSETMTVVRERVLFRREAGGRATTHLARLSSSEEQHFDFILGHHTVPLELVLNLIVACGRMMVRERNATEEQYENSRHRAHGRSGGERTAWSQ